MFSVGLEHFFTNPARQSTKAIVRRAERKRFPERLGDVEPADEFESLDFPALERVMSAYYVEFDRGGRKIRTHQHPGEAFVYVIGGKLAITIGEDCHLLDAGDQIYVESTVRTLIQGRGAGRRAPWW